MIIKNMTAIFQHLADLASERQSLAQAITSGPFYVNNNWAQLRGMDSTQGQNFSNMALSVLNSSMAIQGLSPANILTWVNGYTITLVGCRPQYGPPLNAQDEPYVSNGVVAWTPNGMSTALLAYLNNTADKATTTTALTGFRDQAGVSQIDKNTINTLISNL